MSSEDVVGESGGIPGLVRIIFDSAGYPKRVEIDDLVFNEADKQLISDLFVAALNDASEKLRDRARERFLRKHNKLSDILGLPVRQAPQSSFQGLFDHLYKDNDDEEDEGN